MQSHIHILYILLYNTPDTIYTNIMHSLAGIISNGKTIVRIISVLKGVNRRLS